MDGALTEEMKLDTMILTYKNVAAALAHMPYMHAYLFVLETHFRLYWWNIMEEVS